MNQQLTGRFDVKITPVTEGNISGVPHTRMALDKVFSGGIDATSKGEMLAVRTAVANSAGYIAFERVDGTVAGKRGTFVLQHSGTMNRGAQQLTLTVVPDSGTGELTGISGAMAIVIESGEHTYVFDCVWAS